MTNTQGPPQDTFEKARGWQPKTYTTQKHEDLRFSEVTQKGYKINPMVNRTTRKRSFNDYQATMEVVPQDTDMEEAELTGKRQKVENAPYRKVSGKTWKSGSERASTAKIKIVGSSWDKKMAAKAQKKQLQELKQAAATQQKEQRKAKAAVKQAALERKKQNREKSQVVQKITSSATVKKMLKGRKSRKLIQTADTN